MLKIKKSTRAPDTQNERKKNPTPSMSLHEEGEGKAMLYYITWSAYSKRG